MKAARKRQPNVGGRKLQRSLQLEGKDIGRDKLLYILRQENLLVARKKSYIKTTDSNHWMRKYPNLIRDLELSRPNEVFVSDITYLRIATKFGYLSLTSDLFSRKILGWNLSRDLTAEGTHKAIKQAFLQIS
ncbi:MAG: transposase, partial [Acidobacteriota bacterium]